jgi:hypothetical protein
MMINTGYLRKLLRGRYPNAEVDTADGIYVLPKLALLVATYRTFSFWMRLRGVIVWRKEVMDCDKWARLFVAHAIVRNGKSGVAAGLPVGTLSYCMCGDPERRHRICVAAYWDEERQDVVLQEIEPQPRAGLITLTEEERSSAWAVAI